MSGITRITVCGYKSLCEESGIEVRPLTILAGANSSGKSSIMQPLLLLKQTLEAPYDPDPLKLDGPIVEFTFAEQFLTKSRENSQDAGLVSFGFELDNGNSITSTFEKSPTERLKLVKMVFNDKNRQIVFTPDMSSEEILSTYQKEIDSFVEPFLSILVEAINEPETTAKEALEKAVVHPNVRRNRCFFGVSLSLVVGENVLELPFPPFFRVDAFEHHIRNVIYVPPLRVNPGRTYKTTGIGPEFLGTFDNYVASVIYRWQISKDDQLSRLNDALTSLDLTMHVKAKQVDDVQIELLVGRLPCYTDDVSQDTVSIADVGFGVSQVLPVIVALLVAEPGRLVYIEQPEIHLHPRAQAGLAQLLADAAKRGVRVVVETHSAVLLRSIQALVAEKELDNELVALHWFTRRNDGATRITSANLDEQGAFGDWPEDFAEVQLDVESRYLDAAM